MQGGLHVGQGTTHHGELHDHDPGWHNEARLSVIAGGTRRQFFVPGCPSLTDSLSASLVSLNLECGLQGTDLIALTALKRLRKLDMTILNSCLISQATLDAYGSMPALVMLAVSFTFKTELQSKQLRYRSLSAFQFSPVTELKMPSVPNILQGSAALPQLRCLSLSSARHHRAVQSVPDPNSLCIPAVLSPFGALQTLSLDGVCLYGNLPELSSLQSVTALSLQSVRVQVDVDAHQAALLETGVAGMSSLQSLSLSASSFSLAAWAACSSQQLTKLSLQCMQVGCHHQPLDILMTLTSLQELDLSHNNIQSLPREVTQLVQLTKLDLSRQKFELPEPGSPGNYESDSSLSLELPWPALPGMQVDAGLMDIVRMPKLQNLKLEQPAACDRWRHYEIHYFSDESLCWLIAAADYAEAFGMSITY